MKNIFILFLIIILVVSCSKNKQKNYMEKIVNGVRIVKNSTTPSDNNFKYDFKEVLTLKGENDGDAGFGKVDHLAIDSKNNIFLADLASNSIKKYDVKGVYLLSFGRLGSGPGEYSELKNMTILNDTVIVSDPQGRKMIKYDLEGNYISEKKFNNRTPEFLVPVNKKNQILGLLLTVNPTEKGLNLVSSVVSVDHKFNQQKEFAKISMPFDPTKPQFNPMDLMQPYNASSEKIYISEISEDKLNVQVYDFNGKHLENISKNFLKVKMSKDEMEKLNSSISTTVDNETKENKVKYMFHKAIYGLWNDKYDRLWVLRSKENMVNDSKGISFDIFENGIFLNTIHLPFYHDILDLETNNRVKLMGDYLYFIDDSEDFSIKVYKY